MASVHSSPGCTSKWHVVKALYSSICWRYLAIAMQFGVVLLITRRTSLDTAGEYFALFGIVTVTSIAVGLGIPDGLVRHLPAVRPWDTRNYANSIVLRSIVAAIGISLALVTLGITVAFTFSHFNRVEVMLTGTWWLAYACTFLFAQVLVAQGSPAVGAFVAYSSISIGYLFSLIPFVVLAGTVTLHGLLFAANAGAWAAALLGCYLVVRRSITVEVAVIRNIPPSASRPRLSVRTMLRTGAPMMLSRFMQASLPWIPVWVLIALVSPDESAIYAAASRLIVGVTSVVASLRFSVRPAIVALNTASRYMDIARLNWKCSLLSAVPPLCGIAILLIAGDRLITLVLGDKYLAVNGVLLLLMFGVLAEAFGGMSDEILKMTGRTHVVVSTLGLALLFQIVACYSLAHYGSVVMAVSTAVAFAIQYVGQVLWLSIRTPIKILPCLTSSALAARN